MIKFTVLEILKDDGKTKIYEELYGKEVNVPYFYEGEFLVMESDIGTVVMGNILRILGHEKGSCEVTCNDGLVYLKIS